MKKTLLSVLSLMMGTSLFSVQAQDSTAADKPKFSISGYLDSYYLTSFNNPSSGNLIGYGLNQGTTYTDPDGNAYPIAGGAGRAFDRLTDQFALGLVQTKFAYSDKKTDMVIDLTFGPNAELGNFGNQRYITGQRGYATGFAPANGNQDVLYGTGAAIKQAYFTWKTTSKLSFTVGQFGTHIGYEVIDAPVNFNYSLSNLFNNGPFYHIGAKVNYAVSDKFGLMLGIVNNWDAMTDWKKQKSTIAQVFLSPTDGFNIYLNYIGGYGDDGFKVLPNSGGYKGPGQAITAYSSGYKSYVRHLFDLTAGYQLTDKLYFGINAAYGFYALNDSTDIENAKAAAKAKALPRLGDSNVAWGGFALYGNYKLTDWLALGARYEHFNDANFVRYLGTINNSLTITAPITLGDGRLVVKPEFRMDTTPDRYYERTKSDGTVEAVTSQQTLGVAFIYKY